MADINYIYNDPSRPELIGPVNLPHKPGTMDFKVDGFRGPTDAMFTLEHQAACCYYTIVNAINLANRYLVFPLTNWSAVSQLYVQPRAGKQLNAYYDRQSLKFFYATDPVTQKIIYTSNSTDVVCHEAGHAILDSMRPDLYNMQAMEIWAFHEAFGDIHAIINMLQHSLVLDTVLNETGGDLRQSCSISKLAEEMGSAIYHMTGGRMGHVDGVLRNAFNKYTYVPPETLPANCPDNQLCSEPHNFSRVFTGAWYEILCGIYEDQKTKVTITTDPFTVSKLALIAARDILATYTYRSIRLTPATVRFYDAFAKSMLFKDKENNYMYNQLINQVFIARGILRSPIKPMVALNWSMIQPDVVPADHIEENTAGKVLRTKNNVLLTLPFHMMSVEAPGDTSYEFDSTGDCVHTIGSSPEELIEHAHACVDFLNNAGMIRPDKATPFEINSDGKLIRSHFACGCGGNAGCSGGSCCGCINNCHRPGQPEFGKCWKPENNAGCGCNGTRSCVTNTTEPTIVVQKNTRF